MRIDLLMAGFVLWVFPDSYALNSRWSSLEYCLLHACDCRSSPDFKDLFRRRCGWKVVFIKVQVSRGK
jgi:hypothetical protein